MSLQSRRTQKKTKQQNLCARISSDGNITRRGTTSSRQHIGVSPQKLIGLSNSRVNSHLGSLVPSLSLSPSNSHTRALARSPFQVLALSAHAARQKTDFAARPVASVGLAAAQQESSALSAAAKQKRRPKPYPSDRLRSIKNLFFLFHFCMER